MRGFAIPVDCHRILEIDQSLERNKCFHPLPRACRYPPSELEIYAKTYRQGRHEISFQNDKGAPTSGTQPHISPSPGALEIDVSRDIKLQEAIGGEPQVASSARIDASRMTAEAIQMFGGNAPTAVAYCGLDAWLEGDDAEVRFWGQVLNRLTT